MAGSTPDHADDPDVSSAWSRWAAGGHGHAAPAPASARTRRIVAAVLVPAMAATLVALVVLWPGGTARPTTDDGERRAYGTVRAVAEEPCPSPDDPAGGVPVAEGQRCGTAEVRVTDGPGSGRVVTVPLPLGPGAPSVEVGDDVVLIVLDDAEVSPGFDGYALVDTERGQPLVLLVALAAAVIVAFGRWRGLSALAGLAVSFGVLLVFVIPAILSGAAPLPVAVVGAATIMFAVLYLTHGVSVHTSVAILGTLASLVLTGLLAAGFTGLTALTGVGSEESAYLSTFAAGVDLRGLLLAGIIIGSLGVLDDVTVTQATTVAELARSPRPRRELYRAATRVGRAHVASAVNTIVLAYAGASLPLLLLLAAGNADVSDLLTSEFLAQEIVRTAVGTIGLVASVPITTALAVLVADTGPTGAARPGTPDTVPA